MSSVDNRIVDMKFNNKQFEDGVKETLKSLDNLKRGLNLDESKKSLNNLAEAGKNFSLSNIADSVESIANRFSTMGIIGMKVITELTSAAINLGKRLVGSVITPLTEGGAKRARNIEQARFQFRGLGMDIEATMENALYAVTDTAYGLDEAAKVASQLGASGMRAGDDMATALRAVSGVAAMTSSSYEDIGHIFTTVAGNGRLMGQQLLQLSGRGLNVAAAIGESMGKSEAEIRKMVSQGKISFEDFYKAMDATFGEHATKANETYAGSLSNVRANLAKIGEVVYLQHFENMIKIYNSLLVKVKEVQKAVIPFLNEYNEYTAKVSTNISKMIDSWDSKTLIPIFEGVKNIFIALGKVIVPIKDAFRDIFPPTTNKRLMEITEGFRVFTEKLIIGETTANNLKRTFKGLFAFIDIGIMLVTEIIRAIIPAAGIFTATGDGVLGLTGNLGDFIVRLRDAIKESDIFKRIFEPIGRVIGTVAKGVRKAVDSILETITSIRGTDTSGVDEFGKKVERGFRPITFITETIEKAFNIVVSVIKKAGPAIVNISSMIGKALSKVWSFISDIFANFDSSKGLELFNAGMMGVLIMGFKEFIEAARSFIATGSGIMRRIRINLDEFKVTLKGFQAQIKANVLKSIAVAVGLLVASMWVLSTIDTNKLVSSMGAITMIFADLFAFVALFSKLINAKQLSGIGKTAAALVVISTAVLLLSFSMRTLAKLDWIGIGKGLAGVTGLMLILVSAAKLLEKTSGKMIKGAAGFILFAVAINTLTKAVAKLGALDVNTLTKGLVGVGILMLELVIFMKLTDANKMGMIKSAGLILFANSLIILSNVVKKIGEMDSGDIIRGLLGLSGILLELVIFTKLLGGNKKMMTIATSMVILSAAITSFSRSLTRLGDMTWGEIAKGLVGLAGGLGIMVVAMHAAKGTIAGSTSLVVMATSLAILVPVLKILGGMSIVEIGKSLITLAATFGILGVAAIVLAPITPIILTLAASILLLGTGVGLVGAGILVLSAGLAALAISGSAGIGALVLGITALIGLIPMFAKQVANSILIVIDLLARGAPGILNALVSIFSAIGNAILEIVPLLIEIVVTVLGSVLGALGEGIIQGIPMIAEILLTFLTSMLNVLMDFLPKLIAAGMELLLSILEGIRDNIGKVVKTAIEIVVNFINAVADMLPEVIQAGFNLIISFINGLADAIRGNTTTLVTAMKNLIGAIITAAIDILVNAIPGLKTIGKTIMESGLIKGIGEKITAIKTKVKEVITAGLDKAKEFIGKFKNVGKDLIAGIITGFNDKITSIKETAKRVANNALTAIKNTLGIKSPSREFAKVGRYAMEGMSGGIDRYSRMVDKSADNMGKGTIDTLSDIIKTILDILDDDPDFNPTIRPVLDMDDIVNGLDSVFSNTRRINTELGFIKANNSFRGRDDQQRGGNSNSETTTINNVFNVQATVRRDSDIKEVSQELYKLQTRTNRVRGAVKVV